MKSLFFALSLMFVASGCVIESNRPANSTPETAASASASASTTADPAPTTAPEKTYPPTMHAAPGQ